MASPIVSYECQNKIAHIRLNRPEKLNALSRELANGLTEALYRLDSDDDAWVGILSGEGRAFCVGADFNDRAPFATVEGGGKRLTSSPIPQVFLRRYPNYKPVITAVHGYVYGAGFVLVLDSDLVVADDTAKFQVTETVRGIDGTSLWARLNVLTGGAFADDLAFTGRVCGAAEAARVGLVNRLASAGGHLDEAQRLAEDIVALPPLAVRANVRTRRIQMERMEIAMTAETSNRTLHESADFLESVAAVKEKRTPVFQAR